ncbi:hypothetical protein [Vibrio sp. NH-UV-68]|uniref:hypothetical protein n=1 Tax=unclassified Vibrio TaxID=2614977 RepID=UPI0036F300E2
MNIRIVTVAMVLVALVAGCSSSGTNYAAVNMVNSKFDESKFPYRLKLKKQSEDFVIYSMQAAGDSGETIAKSSALLLKDIHKEIELKCGFKPNDLIDTRIVSYESPEFYEVWVYHNEESPMPDKRTALSVVLVAYPDGGGTDIHLHGNCNPVPRDFSFPI